MVTGLKSWHTVLGPLDGMTVKASGCASKFMLNRKLQQTSICDLGCGFGDLLDYLSRNQIETFIPV